jgi:hypothetical protein
MATGDIDGRREFEPGTLGRSTIDLPWVDETVTRMR